MNDDGLGFSPWLNQAAVGGPLEVTFGRDRRVRFFSGAGAAAAGRGAMVGLAAATAFLTAVFALATTRALGFGGLAGGAGLRLRAAEAFDFSYFAAVLILRATGRATFFPAPLFTPAARFFPCTLTMPPFRGCEMDGAV